MLSRAFVGIRGRAGGDETPPGADEGELAAHPKLVALRPDHERAARLEYAPRVSDDPSASAPAVSAPDAFPAPRDVTLRFHRAVGVGPVWLGLGLVLAYWVLWLAWGAVVAALGGVPGWSSGWLQIRWEIVNAAMIAYLFTATVTAVEGARRDLRGLRPLLGGPPGEFEDLLDRATNTPARLLHQAGALGVLVGALIVAFDPGVWGERSLDLGDPELGWVLFRNVLTNWLAWRLGVHEIVLARGFALAARRVAVDLLDPRPLAVFARKSQRSVAVWVGFIVIFSTFWLGDAAGRANVFFLVLILAFLGPIYLVPLLGVHRRLVAAKQAEIDRVNERIRYAISVDEAAPASRTRLADWVAYRGLVEDAREWPLNAPALVRSLLFVALGVGSWLGGALVERLLGALIG